MDIVQFRAGHLDSLDLQEAQAFFAGRLIDGDYRRDLEASNYAYSGLVDGKTVAVLGIFTMSPGRGLAWGLVGQDAGKHMVAITRGIKRFLDETNYGRVEAAVVSNFMAGHRWARMLGFKCETPEGMDNYYPGGIRAYLYARTK